MKKNILSYIFFLFIILVQYCPVKYERPPKYISNNFGCHSDRSEESSVYGSFGIAGHTERSRSVILVHGSTEFILSEAEGLTMTSKYPKIAMIQNCI